ncbi:MAG: hypothetical protein KGL46_07565 [Hyphomicrobiales bacterium]|nr:hypothetical protein [Hyphomicrobiales bacterium]
MTQLADTGREKALVEKPFEVRLGATRHGSFVDLHDAIDAARIVKRENPADLVCVRNAATGQVTEITN